jgi:hypothetical protein
MGPFANGMVFEAAVAAQLSRLQYKGLPFLVIGTAGATGATDVRFQWGDLQCALEAKARGAFEAGQKKYSLDQGVLRLPPCLHADLLPGYLPFHGKIPPFLQRRMTSQEWAAVKSDYQDEYVINESLTSVANYYKAKGSSYIQIEGYGLYKTSEEDPLEFGVPLMECKTSVRIRCKKHKTVPLSMSVMCSIIYDKASLRSSPICLMDLSKVPPGVSHL